MVLEKFSVEKRNILNKRHLPDIGYKTTLSEFKKLFVEYRDVDFYDPPKGYFCVSDFIKKYGSGRKRFIKKVLMENSSSNISSLSPVSKEKTTYYKVKLSNIEKILSQ